MKAKPMNSKRRNSKFNLSNFVPYFRTLYSNDACIECGTKKPWYWAIIIFIVSIIVAMIPLTVTASNQSGATYLSGNTYGFKEAITDVVLDEHYVAVQGYLSDVDIINHEAKLDIDLNNPIDPSYNGTDKFYYLGYHESLYNTDTTQNTYKRDLDIYFAKNDSIYSFNEIVSEINSTMYDYLGQEGGVNYNGSHNTPRTVSYILFAKNYFAISIFQPGDTSTTAKVGFSGDYNYVEDTNFEVYLLQNTTSLTGTEISNQIYENLKSFANLVYKNNRTSLIWIQSGLSLGVNAGITLLLGLIVFLMTRGKSNPNRSLKFYQCLLIAFYAALTPALITLILGFIISSMAIMVYVMVFGFRVMWMTMRSLRPQYTN